MATINTIPQASSQANPTALPIAQALAARLAAIQISSVSTRAIQTSVTAILDTVGVTLAGAAEPAVRILQRTLGAHASSGAATLFGLRERGSLSEAVMINGTASHAIDYDDMASAMGGHPSVPVVPVIFALGEVLNVSGLQLIEAYIVGFEAECRLGRTVHPHHYEHGWHPTSTLGVFGAAAAAARLLRLDEAKTATALSIAASMACGVKANFGTMTKPLHVGHACRDGLLAAQLAEGGFTAGTLAFESREGFYAAYDGLANVHREKIEEPDSLLEIEHDEIGLKQFPCCGSTHPAIQAMLHLRRTKGLKAEDVSSIEIVAHRRRLPHTDNPDPRTPLAAKFSIQYGTVRALLDGAPRLRHFEGEAFLEPKVQELLKTVTAKSFADAGAADRSLEMACEVNVRTRTGEILTGRAENALGRGSLDPMSNDEMWDKFSDCASCVLPDDQVEQVFHALQHLADCERISEIMALLST